MVNEMQIEILNGREILVNCKSKLKQNLNLNLYCKIQSNSNPIKSQFEFVPRDIEEFQFLDFD